MEVNMKKEKKIIIMNGRWGRGQHIYIGAYSVADACIICEKLSGSSRCWRSEINNYFSKGCWGNNMNGIEPQRGAWICEDTYRSKPVRVL